MERFTNNIPKEVTQVSKTLTENGFQAYLVGGCVRDLLLHKKPNDWDITTNATPDQIIGLFPHTFYENTYGTVGVVTDETAEESLRLVEVTPYRMEGEYSNNRHPDTVTFSDKLEDDLKRRDFTINAIAFEIDSYNLIDPYKGQNDLKDKIIRAVGDPGHRVSEDALRMIRAVRLACQLGFTIEPETEKAIVDNANLLSYISAERIRDEFTKMIMSDHPKTGIELTHKLGILRFIGPELEEGIGVLQGGAHTYDVWEHILRSLQHTADKRWPLEIRLAALFHDVGKPRTYRKAEGTKPTFYGHEVVGARMTKEILNRLKFPQKTIERIVKLVRWHMFFSDTETITHTAVRRMVANVGEDAIWDLMDIRVADRIGTGRPKEEPYRLRKYHAMIDEVLRDPVSVGMLKIDGSKIIELGEKPSPRIGAILLALLEEVIKDPKLNTEKYLEKRTIELMKVSDTELKKLGEEGRKIKEAEEEKEVEEIRKKHFVK